MGWADGSTVLVVGRGLDCRKGGGEDREGRFGGSGGAETVDVDDNAEIGGAMNGSRSAATSIPG